MLTAGKSNVDAVRVLVSNGGSVEATDYSNATALVKALHCGSEHAAAAMASPLIDYGSDVNAVDDRGSTILHMVVHLGYRAVVPLLANCGVRANAMAVPPRGCDVVEGDADTVMTPLHLACAIQSVNVSVITALLKVGSAPTLDAVPISFRSPVHPVCGSATVGHVWAPP